MYDICVRWVLGNIYGSWFMVWCWRVYVLWWLIIKIVEGIWHLPGSFFLPKNNLWFNSVNTEKNKKDDHGLYWFTRMVFKLSRETRRLGGLSRNEKARLSLTITISDFIFCRRKRALSSRIYKLRNMVQSTFRLFH